MNAGFIGIGSMGGTLVRALATESRGNLGGAT
jgi:pyrroline-5-carboxylate reductase